MRLTHADLAVGIGTARFFGGAMPPASLPGPSGVAAATGMSHETVGAGVTATAAGARWVSCGKAAVCLNSDWVGMTADTFSPCPESASGATATKSPASPASPANIFFIFPTPCIRTGRWNMSRGVAWRQCAACPSLICMRNARSGMPLPFAAIVALILAATIPSRAATAQGTWTGVGAISGTAMYMDTTTIVRTGNLRKVWVRSIDSAPKSFVAGKDTLDFDTVIGLNVFDCAKHTRTVTTVTYLLGNDIIFNVPETHDTPEQLKPRSFFDAVYNDLCGTSSSSPKAG
jgi:surface-adhesin protein E